MGRCFNIWPQITGSAVLNSESCRADYQLGSAYETTTKKRRKKKAVLHPQGDEMSSFHYLVFEENLSASWRSFIT